MKTADTRLHLCLILWRQLLQH